ncbi:MAG: ACP S-malonyltransferase [Sarcina sp.]
MKKIAFLFAGQGSQYKGMGKDFYENFEVSKKVFDNASDVLGFDITDICFNNVDDKLNKTEYTQPCIVTTNMAILEALKECGINTDISCGLSLGEYSALIHDGVMKFEDGVQLVKKRGKFMQESVPEGIGGMLAVLKLNKDEVEEVVLEAKNNGIVEIANYNSPSQIVISGEISALDKASELIKEKGGRAIRLNVSAPFHSSMLSNAADKLGKELENVKLNAVSGIILSNFKGTKYENNDNIKSILMNQVKGSVKFVDNIEFIKSLDVDIFVEIGPGKVLSGFVKKIDKSITVLNVDTIEDLHLTIKRLKELEVI